MSDAILVLNAGSSSLKVSEFTLDGAGTLAPALNATFQELNGDARFRATDPAGEVIDAHRWRAGQPPGHEGALDFLTDWLRGRDAGLQVVAIGHRVVHGGTAYGIKLTTRPGISGAAANFKFWGDVDNPYLRVNPRDEGGADIRTDVKKDTTLGSGLYWAIEPREVRDVRLIEVWDSRTFGDDLVDRIELPGNAWQAEGQQFVVELVGVKEQPEPWALPMLAAGVTAVLLMVGVFLWTAAV